MKMKMVKMYTVTYQPKGYIYKQYCAVLLESVVSLMALKRTNR